MKKEQHKSSIYSDSESLKHPITTYLSVAGTKSATIVKNIAKTSRGPPPMKLKSPPIQMSSIGTEDLIEPGIISPNKKFKSYIIHRRRTHIKPSASPMHASTRMGRLPYRSDRKPYITDVRRP